MCIRDSPEADTPYDFTQAVSADVVLYAHWAEIQAGATMVAVTFDYNGAGTLTARTESIVSGNSVEKPQDPDVEGRTFTGWFTLRPKAAKPLTSRLLLPRISPFTPVGMWSTTWCASTTSSMARIL